MAVCGEQRALGDGARWTPGGARRFSEHDVGITAVAFSHDDVSARARGRRRG